MPQKVKLQKGREFQFKSAPTGGHGKYDWDSWFDGNLWLIERSTVEVNAEGEVTKVIEKRDFEVDVNAMPGKLKHAARKRYKVVQISRRDANGEKLTDALIIKARDMTADERAEEDILRAEEKEEAKEKRKARSAAGSNGSAGQTAATEGAAS